MGFTNNHQPHQRLTQVSCLSAIPLCTPSTPFLPQPMAAPTTSPHGRGPHPRQNWDGRPQARRAPRAGLHLPTKARAEPRKCPQLHADTWWRPHGRGAHSKKQAGPTARLGTRRPSRARCCGQAPSRGGNAPWALCRRSPQTRETWGSRVPRPPHAPIALWGGLRGVDGPPGLWTRQTVLGIAPDAPRQQQKSEKLWLWQL